MTKHKKYKEYIFSAGMPPARRPISPPGGAAGPGWGKDKGGGKMRSLFPAAPILLFPYWVLLILYGLFLDQDVMRVLFDRNILWAVFSLGVLWLVGLVCALLLFIRAGDALEAARTGMALKLAQIPAYLVIFGVGLACVITIFTIGISLLLALLDMASLFLTGLVGLGAVQRCRRAGLLTGRQAVFHGLLQFVPCADVVSSVMVFRRVKAATRGN